MKKKFVSTEQNPLKLILDLNCMPKFYADLYPTRLLLKYKPSASATASATVAEVFPIYGYGFAYSPKVSFGRPLQCTSVRTSIT